MKIGVVLVLALAAAVHAGTVIVGGKDSTQKGPWCGT